MRVEFGESEEDPVPFIAKAHRLHVHVSALSRWRDVGVRGPGGTRIKLRCLKVGGRWYVRDADWAAFIAATNDVPKKNVSAPRP